MRFGIKHLLMLAVVGAAVCAAVRLLPDETVRKLAPVLPGAGCCLMAALLVGGLMGLAVARRRWGMIVGAVVGVNWMVLGGAWGAFAGALALDKSAHASGWAACSVGGAVLGTVVGGLLGGVMARTSWAPKSSAGKAPAHGANEGGG